MAATKILRCYPDYGKAPPEYVVNLMAVLERYSVDVISQLADVQRGLPGKCRFLPVPADVTELGDKLEAERKAECQRPALPDYSGLRRFSMDDYAKMRVMPLPDSARRKQVVMETLGYDPSQKRGLWKSPDEEERPLKYTDKELLFRCHAEAEAEQNAKRAAKQSKRAA